VRATRFTGEFRTFITRRFENENGYKNKKKILIRKSTVRTRRKYKYISVYIRERARVVATVVNVKVTRVCFSIECVALVVLEREIGSRGETKS